MQVQAVLAMAAVMIFSHMHKAYCNAHKKAQCGKIILAAHHKAKEVNIMLFKNTRRKIRSLLGTTPKTLDIAKFNQPMDSATAIQKLIHHCTCNRISYLGSNALNNIFHLDIKNSGIEHYRFQRKTYHRNDIVFAVEKACSLSVPDLANWLTTITEYEHSIDGENIIPTNVSIF
jgi:hypothetical protein